jgi:N-carbamoyl-L-amino-acid hydrolase
MSPAAEVNGARLIQSLADFAAIGATPNGGVNRQALSVEDRAARRLLAERALARGFSVFQDEAANLFIRREGTEPSLASVLIGSHLDSQPTGGRFDGALGTLSAFEVLEALSDAGLETRRAIEVVAFTNEEGSRYAPGCMGSMSFANVQPMAAWHGVRGTDGVLLHEELSATINELPEARMRPNSSPISAFVELHIEQGPILEREGAPIGVVTAVQGTKWFDVTFVGQAAHAGTTPQEFRRDAMAAAAAAISQLQSTIMPADALARLTIGRLSVEPGSINVIPARVSFTVDLRHPDLSVLVGLERQLRDECEKAGVAWGCSILVEERMAMEPGRFDERISALLEDACEDLGVASRRMISGAFHDALFVSRVAPTAMIFVPCKDGISHNEAEFVADEHVVLGARTLLALARILAQEP